MGLDCYAMHWNPLHNSRWDCVAGQRPGISAKGCGQFSLRSSYATHRPEVRTMPNCIACGAELEPPVRVPHTVYVKTLYRIVGQDYCRQHVIRAAVAAGCPASSTRSNRWPAPWWPRTGECFPCNTTSLSRDEPVYGDNGFRDSNPTRNQKHPVDATTGAAGPHPCRLRRSPPGDGPSNHAGPSSGTGRVGGEPR